MNEMIQNDTMIFLQIVEHLNTTIHLVTVMIHLTQMKPSFNHVANMDQLFSQVTHTDQLFNHLTNQKQLIMGSRKNLRVTFLTRCQIHLVITWRMISLMILWFRLPPVAKSLRLVISTSMRKDAEP